MARVLEPYQAIERSIITKYRKTIWRPFVEAVKRYELVRAGDKIAVCISGGKDSIPGYKSQGVEHSFLEDYYDKG